MHLKLSSWLMRSYRTVLEHASQFILCRLCPSWERVPCWMLGPFHWPWAGLLFPWSPTVSAEPLVVVRGSWDNSPWMRRGVPTWPMQRGTTCTTCVINWITKAVKPSVCFDYLLPLLARHITSRLGTFLSSHIVSTFSVPPAGLQSATEDETGTERDHWGNWWLQGGWQYCWAKMVALPLLFGSNDGERVFFVVVQNSTSLGILFHPFAFELYTRTIWCSAGEYFARGR